jgi:hypothetical protein
MLRSCLTVIYHSKTCAALLRNDIVALGRFGYAQNADVDFCWYTMEICESQRHAVLALRLTLVGACKSKICKLEICS